MDTLLLVLGLAGGCAIVVSVLVSSSNSKVYTKNTLAGLTSSHTSRRGNDRRSGVLVNFPLQINGLTVREDRRCSMDRRFAAA